jgi:hypothetical protein
MAAKMVKATTTLSKKYLTLGWENKVLYLGDYNT